MCWLNALPRRNLPFFVRLKRLAAPRWVLSLIFFAFFAIVSCCFTAETAEIAERTFLLCVLLCGLCDLRGFYFVVRLTSPLSPSPPPSPCRRRSAAGASGWCASGCLPSAASSRPAPRPPDRRSTARESAARCRGGPSRDRGKRSSLSLCRRPRGSARYASS